MSVGRIGYQSPLAVAVQGVQVDRYYPVVTAGEGDAQAYGAYVEVVASAAADIYLIGMSIGSTETRVSNMGYAAVGTGGAGAETVIAEVAYYLLSEASAAYVRFSAPIPVPSGTRVAVKVTSVSSSASYDHKVSLHYVNQAAVA